MNNFSLFVHVGRMAAVFWLSLALPIIAHALPQPMDTQTFQAALAAGKFTELDAQLNEIQAAYDRGEIDDIVLQRHFSPVYEVSAALTDRSREWTEKSPKSYAAHFNRGVSELAAAIEARGHKYAAETSEANFYNMLNHLSTAEREQKTALLLAKKPVLSYSDLITIAQYGGNTAASRAALDAAIKVAPGNFIVRRSYMSALRARWLGNESQAKAKAFLASCRKSKLTKEQLNILQAMILADMANDLYDEDKYAKSIDLYQKALATIGSNGGLMERGRYTELFIHLAWNHYALDQYESALTYVSRARQSEVGCPSPCGREVRALSLFSLRRVEEAMDDIQAMAAEGNEWGTEVLGRCYLLGACGLPRNAQKARQYGVTE